MMRRQSIEHESVAQCSVASSSRAVDFAGTTPNAPSVKAEHDGDPSTPTKGDDGEDDNAQANQYWSAGFGICSKMRNMEAKLPAFD